MYSSIKKKIMKKRDFSSQYKTYYQLLLYDETTKQFEHKKLLLDHIYNIWKQSSTILHSLFKMNIFFSLWSIILRIMGF